MKEMTPSQIVKITDVLDAALRKRCWIYRRDDIQAVLGSPEMMKLLIAGFITRLEQLVQDLIIAYRILVNYDQPKAIVKAVQGAGLAWSQSCEVIPLVGVGQIMREVYEVRFGRLIHNCDLPNALKQRGRELGFKDGFKFADPLTTLHFVRDYLQRNQSLTVLFIDIMGRPCYLFVNVYEGRQMLGIYISKPDDYWNAGMRFLAVPA